MGTPQVKVSLLFMDDRSEHDMDVSATALPTFPFGIDRLGSLAAFAQPISTENQTGADLRGDLQAKGAYQRLRDARGAARNAERTALANGDADFIRDDDWQPVIDIALPLLKNESKDIEIAAWLIEALTRAYGFSGIAAGFAIAATLITTFGARLRPMPDEEGLASQLAALAGLNGYGSEGALIAPIKSIPLTEGATPAPFCAWQCEQAFATDRAGDEAKRAARSKRGFILRADIDQAVAETGAEFFVRLDGEIGQAVVSYQGFQRAIDNYCADQPQPTGRILETLESCRQTLRHIAGGKLAAAQACAMLESGGGASGEAASDKEALSCVAGGIPQTAAAAPIENRARALQQLRDVALFFRRSEPHSPISYAIEQAVYWSQLSLPELMGELIPDENSRSRFETLVGIRRTDA